MKTYKVSVNGSVYEVKVEEVNGEEVKASAPASAPAAAPKAAPAPVSGDGADVTAPMPGTILSVNVNVGDTVKSGDVLAILEAMKMENEIMAPNDGKVTYVGTSKGASVNAGDVICRIA